MKIEVIFEDEFLIAVNKPADLPVHETLDRNRPSLQSQLEMQLQKKLVLFHRLDVDTTGVVLLGKDPSINKSMTDAFRDRKIEKCYWAVVDGRWLETWTEVKTYIVKKGGGRWMNTGREKDAQSAVTKFKMLATNSEKSWLEVRPLTGRTHQIRLHCLEKAHPILGDRLYGRADPFGVPMALHARSLKFVHPKSGLSLEVQAELPDYWPEHWLKKL